MCRFMCKDKWSLRENALSHSLHWNGRMPVCFRKCLVNSSLLANFQPQPFHEQWYGFSPVCVLICAFRWELFEYVLAQSSCGHSWILIGFLVLSKRVDSFVLNSALIGLADLLLDADFFTVLSGLFTGSWKNCFSFKLFDWRMDVELLVSW